MTSQDRQLWKSIRNALAYAQKDSEHRMVSRLFQPEFDLLYGEVNAKCSEEGLSLEGERGVLAMAVARLGGLVEGEPTQRINFLQRIDALLEIENVYQDLLCPVHLSLDTNGHLKPFNNCIACIRNQCEELLLKTRDPIGQEPNAQVLRHADTVQGWNADRRITERRLSNEGRWNANEHPWTADEILKRES